MLAAQYACGSHHPGPTRLASSRVLPTGPAEVQYRDSPDRNRRPDGYRRFLCHYSRRQARSRSAGTPARGAPPRTRFPVSAGAPATKATSKASKWGFAAYYGCIKHAEVGMMLIKKKSDLTYADVTPKGLYMGRRNFLLGLLATTGAVEAYKKYPWLVNAAGPVGSVPVKLNDLTHGPYSKDNIQEKVTPIEDVIHYNNYYEFGTDKGDPAKNATRFVTTPWSVSVEGEVKTPRTFTIEEIMKLAPLEERIYRH